MSTDRTSERPRDLTGLRSPGRRRRHGVPGEPRRPLDSGHPPGSRLVRWLAPWVPAACRDEWLAEWRGELSYAREGARSRGESETATTWRLRRRALGAVRDARWLRGAYGAPSPGASAFREATRVLRRQPGFALMVVCTLALGIGAATAIFSVVDGLMLRPLPFHDPERLVRVWIGEGESTSAYADADAARVWRSQDAVFDALHLLAGQSITLTHPGEPQNLRAELVEPGLLRTLGTPPALGREFLPEEAVPGRDRVMMLSHELWRSAFAADPTIVGATIYLDDEPYTVVGVMSASVRVLPGGVPEIAVPLTDPPPSGHGLMLLGRIRADLSLAVAQERLNAVSARLDAERPREAGWGVQLRPLDRVLNTNNTRRGLTALAGAVLLLLLVACANAAGLLFVRGVTRRSELAIRRSLGASRASLFRQSLAESLVLAGLGGLMGTLLAWWGVHALVALVPEELIRFSYTAVGIDSRVLAFAVALTLLTGVAFGVGPALRASRTDSLHASRRASTASGAQARLHSIAQMVQLALAVMLLAGAGLFGRSFLRLTAVHPGFDPHNLLQLTYELPGFRYPKDAHRAAFNREMDARLRALPGVSDVTWTFGGINGGGISFVPSIEREGGTPLETYPFEIIPQASVDTAYFRVMGIPLREGRAFNRDDGVTGVGPVVIDVDLARKLWPGQSAVGKRFRFDAEGEWMTVVGVSEDVKLSGPDDPHGPLFLFYPIDREKLRRPMIVIRTEGDPTVTRPAVRQSAQSLDPRLPITLETGDQLRAEAVRQPRFLLIVMTAFAVVGLILAAVGVYGVVAFTVARRTREFGIRIAVGARGRQIQTSVLARGLVAAAAGLVAGIIAAVWLARFIRGLLFGISPLDPVTIVAVSIVLAVSCTAALLMPARRAARVDPVEALRAE